MLKIFSASNEADMKIKQLQKAMAKRESHITKFDKKLNDINQRVFSLTSIPFKN